MAIGMKAEIEAAFRPGDARRGLGGAPNRRVPRLRAQAALSLACALVLAGCGHIEHKPRGFAQDIERATLGAADTGKPRRILIFFDGTANDEGSDTNVKRLHAMMTLQDRGDIASLYVLGVGTNFDPIGAITGAGINARVTLAYEFILNHYRPQVGARVSDEVHIYGFSRGAYAARILSTMLYFGGIAEEEKAKETPRKFTSAEIARKVHTATFPGFLQGPADDTAGRPATVATALKAAGLRQVADALGRIPVPVKVLGLWDTVEALGAPDALVRPEVNVDIPNPRYGERLCNVEHAFHAVSIDDNRATVFTPILLSRAHLFRGCTASSSPMFDTDGQIKAGHLQEVWFSGAHGDVGGGYLTGTLNGVSLNWMLRRIRAATEDLLPQHSKAEDPKAESARFVRQDMLGTSHDPRAGIWGFYPRVSRDLVGFASDKRSLWRDKLCVHPSVFTRRRVMGPAAHEYRQLALTAHGPVRPDTTGATDTEIDVQSYPGCAFMNPSTPLGVVP